MLHTYKFYNCLQGRNFNKNTRDAEVFLPFSCSLLVIDTRIPYNSTVTKIFGKYLNISKFKLFIFIYILYIFIAHVTNYPYVNTNVSSHDYFSILSEAKDIMVLC
jgi:hypothetical protein